MTKLLSQKRLKTVLHFDGRTGVFRWLVPPLRSACGDIAGYDDGAGYLRMTVDGVRYRAHRLAWLYEYGAFPQIGIDHINGDRRDNRVANLRLATKTQNAANTAIRRSNKTGFKNVIFARGRYVARMRINGRPVHIGAFRTPEAAYRAFRKRSKEVHGEFFRP